MKGRSGKYRAAEREPKAGRFLHRFPRAVPEPPPEEGGEPLALKGKKERCAKAHNLGGTAEPEGFRPIQGRWPVFIFSVKRSMRNEVDRTQ